MYTYHIEDGQFSSEHSSQGLLGDEGDVIKLYDFDDEYTEAYIICIIDSAVHCLGNIERTFPKSKEEHESYKSSIIEAYKTLESYQFTYYNSDDTLSEEPIFIEAYSQEQARKIFTDDYPKLRIYQINVWENAFEEEF